jgi:hypothetical protein
LDRRSPSEAEVAPAEAVTVQEVEDSVTAQAAVVLVWGMGVAVSVPAEEVRELASAQAPGLRRPACWDRPNRRRRRPKLRRRARLRRPW